MIPPKKNHDSRLPEWGPYSKDYAGVSHVTNQKTGLRFDLTAAPGVFRNKILLPHGSIDCGYHPTEASDDLTYYSHRHQIEWKDRVFCDVSFSEWTSSSRLIRCECTNQTPQLQSLSIHFLASLHPHNMLHKLHGYMPLRPGNPVLPPEVNWIDALDYSNIHYTDALENTKLISGGQLRGEHRDHGFVQGSGVRFGKDPQDTLKYDIHIPFPLKEAILLIRYKGKPLSTLGVHIQLASEHNSVQTRSIALEGNGELARDSLAMGTLPAGRYELRLCSEYGDEMYLDGFVLTEDVLAEQIYWEETRWNLVPERIQGPHEHSILLKYDHTDVYYGLAWLYEPAVIREIHHEPLDEFLRIHSRRNGTTQFVGNKEGHYTEIYLRPVNVQPNSSRAIFAFVCSGSKDEVLRQLSHFPADLNICQSHYEDRRGRAIQLQTLSAGETYAFSQQRMIAAMMQNVVYPIYVRRSYIRHFTPGRFWDSLYTWDSGFIGIGMANFSIERAIDALNTYVMDADDPHASFLHHGTVLPVQHYLYMELWNQTRSKETLARFYAGLRDYYLFYAGHQAGSQMRRFHSGLLNPFAYFYNSGGWDDYPAQHDMHSKKLADRIAPAVTTSHGIRIAKIMRMAALELCGMEHDIERYDKDILEWTEALHKYAWDETSGYFGYVLHDQDGHPTTIYKHESGQNYNMGLDGVQPLVAGAVTPEQSARIVSNLSDPERIWSKLGLSTVDQSAPYYVSDGYWNGCVWMPHQWFIWKTLLDLGKGEFAEQIARTALDVWKNSVEDNYNTAEHFIIETGKSGGWHHFSGLSSPVVHWFTALYRPGTVTGGFDTWFRDIRYKGKLHVEADLIKTNDDPAIMLVVLEETVGDYAARDHRGMQLSHRILHTGTIEVELPAGTWEGTVIVNAE
ncbi:MGH1-like glycoside hydrolase domain-containing protein [Paenibacillus swuensis]|uniref:MGH1-like glycoside hydrolase domain-containing protein n=1 Tax=Paenibacillus swuensis TaxID=1178515 RepID=UPI0008387C7F|nr:trehalase family glycosidase [Paenibacillus swuensis]